MRQIYISIKCNECFSLFQICQHGLTRSSSRRAFSAAQATHQPTLASSSRFAFLKPTKEQTKKARKPNNRNPRYLADMPALSHLLFISF
jgi:hypothetical protein